MRSHIKFVVTPFLFGPNKSFDKAFFLSLTALCIPETCIKINVNLSFYFHTSLCYLRRFYEGLEAFKKSFEVQQRSVKIKI